MTERLFDIGIGPAVLVRDGKPDFTFLPKRAVDPSGLSVWSMSHFLAQFLCSASANTGAFRGTWTAESLVRGQSLEVGCGVSPLPSIASARLGLIPLAIDYNREALAVAAENVASSGATVRLEQCSWTERPPAMKSSFDLILCSDILYEEATLSQLAAFLVFCARETATLIIGTKMRNRGFETTFFDTCEEKGWRLVTIVHFTATSGGNVVLWKEDDWRPLDWVTNDKYQIAVLQRKA